MLNMGDKEALHCAVTVRVGGQTSCRCSQAIEAFFSNCDHVVWIHSFHVVCSLLNPSLQRDKAGQEQMSLAVS